MLWDLFCRVIDNHGDLGVSLRLARQLVSRGQRARLWVDDARALQWMLPTRPEALSLHPWPEKSWPVDVVGDVVIETFGCELPDVVKTRMAENVAANRPPPRWLNLEYLSAEAYTLRSHRLPSPVMSGPARGLSKTFWFPGFVPASGGLLREHALMEDQRHHDPRAFLKMLGVHLDEGERLVSLFCYPHAPRQALVNALATQPTLLLGCGGCTEGLMPQGQLRIQALPWLDQDAYDRLLWSCDLNVVRGEDSFVRAQWAARPMLWNIYRQDDQAHAAKLQAYLDLRWPQAAHPAQDCWRTWNGLPAATGAESPFVVPETLWQRDEPLRWRDSLLSQDDLCDQLLSWTQTSPA